jgi:beta-glucanase (GH16 family)
MEYFHKGQITSGNIYGGYGKQFKEEARIKHNMDTDGWHYFGMDWQPDGYVFYCDGKETARCSEHVSHVPQFVLLTTEVHGYRASKKKKKILRPNGEEIEAATYEILDKYEDDAFIVDFVRVYDKVEKQ